MNARYIRSSILFSLALLLLFCQGCGRHTSAMPTDNAYHLETDYQDSYRGINVNFYFADTPEGTAYNGQNRLYMISGDTPSLQLCCFKPECRHDFYSDNCSAILSQVHNTGFQYMNGKLYYIETTGNTANLCCMDITGENREILREDPAELLAGNSGLVFHRGFLYIYCMENRSEQSTTLKLYQLDLENPASDMKLLWEEEIPGMSMCLDAKFTARGNYLFFRDPNYNLYMDTATTPVLLHSMDLQTGKIYDCILPNGELPTEFAVVDDRVFVSVLTKDGYRLTSFSYTFEDSADFPERARQEDFLLRGDTKYLYLWWMNGPTLYILDKNGQQVDSVDISFFSDPTELGRFIAGIYISMQEDGRVFLTMADFRWGFHYFDKSEIGSGQIQIKGLPMVAGREYSDPVPMPDDFTWDWDRFYGHH